MWKHTRVNMSSNYRATDTSLNATCHPCISQCRHIDNEAKIFWFPNIRVGFCSKNSMLTGPSCCLDLIVPLHQQPPTVCRQKSTSWCISLCCPIGLLFKLQFEFLHLSVQLSKGTKSLKVRLRKFWSASLPNSVCLWSAKLFSVLKTHKAARQLAEPHTPMGAFIDLVWCCAFRQLCIF